MAKQERKPKESKLKILAAGDIHGKNSVAEHLAEKAEKNKVDLVVLTGDLHGSEETEKGIIAPFEKRGQKVIFVPGNWDSKVEMDLLKRFYQAKNIDGYYVNYKGTDIVGIGSGDFELQLDNKKAWGKLKKNFDRIKTKSGKRVLISHLHAAGTKAEFSGIRGENVLRKAIKEFQPDVFISSHIHEAEGIEERIGKTKVFQVGIRGKIIEI